MLTFTFPDPTAVITVAAAAGSGPGSRPSTRGSARCRPTAAPSSSTSSATASPIRRSGATTGCMPTAAATSGSPPRRPRRSVYGDADEAWARPLPGPAAQRRSLARYASDAVWMGRHLTPWLIRRLRGEVAPGDGRDRRSARELGVVSTPTGRIESRSGNPR